MHRQVFFHIPIPTDSGFLKIQKFSRIFFFLKRTGSFFKTVLLISCTPIFDRNRQNMTSFWRYLRPTYQDLENFLRSGYVK